MKNFKDTDFIGANEFVSKNINTKKFGLDRLNTPINSNKKDLGQVFTSQKVAKFMTSLFEKDIESKHSILDPCIGPNTFFTLLKKLEVNPTLVGMEVDRNLITQEIEMFYKANNRYLITKSFFDLPISEKFDFIIQNPPYIRQELLMNGINSKENIKASFGEYFKKLDIPSKSNLYVYFLLKSILHLKNNGRMIAVIYDSWLYSKFGAELKKTFTELGVLEAVYHFKRDVFIDADIGATIIDFRKTSNNKSKIIKIYGFDSPKAFSKPIHTFKATKISPNRFINYNGNKTDIFHYDSEVFTKIEHISSTKLHRGTSAISNKHFILENANFNETLSYIKDVTKIKNFSVEKEDRYLLVIDNKISSKTKEYLKSVKEQILNTPDKFKALKRTIIKNKSWYKIKPKSPGNIIFNYYLRSNIHFILNKKLLTASDNFYVLNVQENLFANFAILNSSVTKITVLENARNQGNGLKKIQLYEFSQVPVVDINKISKKNVLKLESLGKELKKVNRFDSSAHKHLLKSIDSILIQHLNNSLDLKVEYNDLQNIVNKIS